MKISFENRINWLISNLQNSQHDYTSWRYAGALELCLQEVGAISLEKLPERKSGGKCYIPILIDSRWKETYPQMILRVAKEYIENKNQK